MHGLLRAFGLASAVGSSIPIGCGDQSAESARLSTRSGHAEAIYHPLQGHVWIVYPSLMTTDDRGWSSLLLLDRSDAHENVGASRQDGNERVAITELRTTTRHAFASLDDFHRVLDEHPQTIAYLHVAGGFSFDDEPIVVNLRRLLAESEWVEQPGFHQLWKNPRADAGSVGPLDAHTTNGDDATP